jgi:hypothetical protein
MKATNCEKKKANVEIWAHEEEICITTHNFHEGGSHSLLQISCTILKLLATMFTMEGSVLLQWRWNQVCKTTRKKRFGSS